MDETARKIEMRQDLSRKDQILTELNDLYLIVGIESNASKHSIGIRRKRSSRRGYLSTTPVWPRRHFGHFLRR